MNAANEKKVTEILVILHWPDGHTTRTSYPVAMQQQAQQHVLGYMAEHKKVTVEFN